MTVSEGPPRPYDLTMPGEPERLIRELRGYMRVSRTNGTDHRGRQFALDALEILAKGDWKIVVHPPEERAYRGHGEAKR